MTRMIVCPLCGNKRCPHASDHRNACTNSNESGQPGSAAPEKFQKELLQCVKRLETVAYRLRQTLRGEEWTRREHDAAIIEDEVISVLKDLSGTHPEGKSSLIEKNRSKFEEAGLEGDDVTGTTGT
jgi:hypothetical protein